MQHSVACPMTEISKSLNKQRLLFRYSGTQMILLTDFIKYLYLYIHTYHTNVYKKLHKYLHTYIIKGKKRLTLSWFS